MISRSSLKTGAVPTMVAGLLLFTLAGASLGCAYAACYGVADAPAAPAVILPRAAAPLAHPMAGVAEHGRCPSAATVRARRAGCRAADLPAV